MIIPLADRAIVDIRKLRDYCLNPEHEEGKHKAHLFASVLEMTAEHADELRKILLDAVVVHDAREGRRDQYGQRYVMDFELEWYGRRATIRSGWIVKQGTDQPRLTTCFPL